MLDIANALVGSIALGRQIGQFDRDDLRLAVGFCAEAKLGFRQIVQAGSIEKMRSRDALLVSGVGSKLSRAWRVAI